jgi:hypothetical protein
MTVDRLLEGHTLAYEADVSLKSSLMRATRTLLRTDNLLSTPAPFYWNYEFYKKITKK